MEHLEYQLAIIVCQYLLLMLRKCMYGKYNDITHTNNNFLTSQSFQYNIICNVFQLNRTLKYILQSF